MNIIKSIFKFNNIFIKYMSRPFKTYSGKATFAEVKEPISGREYILNKIAKMNYCNSNMCLPNQKVNTQGNLLLLKKSNKLKNTSNFNKNELYNNLYTKLDLKDICPITDLSGNCPVEIDPLNPIPPYINYIIDPSGALFGDSSCGITNFTSYMV